MGDLYRTNYDAIGNMAGIDVNHLIYDNGSQVASINYTATEDAYMTFIILSGSGDALCNILVDGINVGGTNKGASMSGNMFIKKGQVITSRNISGATYRIMVYGLKW